MEAINFRKGNRKTNFPSSLLFCFFCFANNKGAGRENKGQEEKKTENKTISLANKPYSKLDCIYDGLRGCD